MKVLFVTWDGPQVTYLESLFVPIFGQLAKEGITFEILQFTWGDAERVEWVRRTCAQAGLGYTAITVWRWPRAAGALLTALVGAWRLKKFLHAHRFDLVIARSVLPALAAMLALRGSRCPMVFDADGLPLDERVDFAGEWPSNLIYRLLRDVEAEAVRRADVVLVRTVSAKEILYARAGAGTKPSKFYVVGNGRDADVFKPADDVTDARVRSELGVDANTPLLVYVGSIGRQYCVDQMLQLFSMVLARRSDAHFLLLTGSPEAARSSLCQRPGLEASVTTLSLPASAVPQYLGCADLGLALREPTFSMQAVSPIKLGEYLLCGVPVVATAGIGDAHVIAGDAGVLVQRMDPTELRAVVDWFFDEVLPKRDSYRASARAVGLAHFSLGATSASYKQALASFCKA